MMIKKMIHVFTMVHVSDEAFRVGVIQFSNKAYSEVKLGDTHNLRELVSRLLKIRFRNENNSVPAAIEAGIEMILTR